MKATDTWQCNEHLLDVQPYSSYSAPPREGCQARAERSPDRLEGDTEEQKGRWKDCSHGWFYDPPFKAEGPFEMACGNACALVKERRMKGSPPYVCVGV